MTRLFPGLGSRSKGSSSQSANHFFKLNLGTLLILALFIGTNATLVSCKKKPAPSVTEEQQKIQQAKNDLLALLNDTNKSPEQLEQELARIKAMNLTDPEVLRLIGQVEEKIARLKAERLRAEEEEAKRKAEEERRARELANSPENRLARYFTQISSAANPAAADAAIQQALEMFSSPTADVLIIISKASNGELDYDEPTNIKKYLEYLKDVKRPADAVEKIEYDSNGKIKLLELTKIK